MLSDHNEPRNYENVVEINRKVFNLTSYENATLLGRASKDGSVKLGYKSGSINPIPQIVQKIHKQLANNKKEEVALLCFKERLLKTGTCFHFPLLLSNDVLNQTMYSTWEGYSMANFKHYFDHNSSDIASMVIQFSYTNGILVDTLNLKHEDLYRENIIVKPVPSMGVYRLTYVFRYE